MKKKYISVSFYILEEYFDIVAAMLSQYPLLGIEERIDEIAVTFDMNDWNDELRNRIIDTIQSIYPDTKLINEIKIDEINWNEEWEKNVPALSVTDRIGIAPQWRINELDKEIKIIINPKMSFGTGEHATTRLMCKLMEDTVKPNSFWLDAGTGTGALAILAIKLGASKCYAFDNSFWSVDNSKENIELNGFSDRITVEEADIDEIDLPGADGIVANMNYGIISRSLEKFYNSLKYNNGALIISGIMIYDKDEVIKKAESIGFHLIDIINEDEWIAFKFSTETK